MKTGIKLNIDHPKLLGKDLVALSAYAASKGKNVIVVNFGTANTIIHVKNNTLNGAVISPGIKTQYDALIKNTSQIHDIILTNSKKAIGKNTQEAVSLGIINITYKGIESIIKEIDPLASVYYSGGNAALFKSLLGYEYVEEATLLGIELIKRKNEK